MWFSRPKRIYLDHASATPLMPEAQKEMEHASLLIGNPGAIHADGVAAQKKLDEARDGIARELACKAREVIFTAGGTEGNNIAILGLARHLQCQGVTLTSTHWITSAIEHPSVLECFTEIERLGGKVTHVDPDSRGIIDPEKVREAMKDNTSLVSIGWANSEIGVVQPIREIARAVRDRHTAIIVHTDAGQAPLYLAPHVHTLGVDLMTLDSGKFYGPRGVGALYISNTVELSSVMFGGGQERGIRPGTENVALAAGFAKAFSIIANERNHESRRIRKIRADFARALCARIPSAILNGDLGKSLPHILNVSIPNIQSEYVTLALDARGVSISTKSACREGTNRRSHVVEALGGAEWRAENTLRFSLGRETRESDLHRVIDILVTQIHSL
jgi:cysteine desulfurase